MIKKPLLTFRTVNPLKAIDAIALPQIAGPPPRAVVRASRAHVFRLRDDQRHGVRLEFVVVHREEPPAGVQVLQQAHVDEHRLSFGFSLRNHVVIEGQTQIYRRMRHICGCVVGSLDFNRVRDVERSSVLRISQNLPSSFITTGNTVKNVSPVLVPVLIRLLPVNRRFLLINLPFSELVVDPPPFHKLHEVVLGHAGGHVAPAVDREVGAPWQREVEADERGLLVPELRVPELVRRDGDRVERVEVALFQQGQRRPLRLRSRLAALLGRLQRDVLGCGAGVFRSTSRQ